MSWIPGWDSVAATSWWSSFYFWCSIVALIGLGVFEIASHRYSDRKDEIAAAEQAAKDKQHDDEVARLHLETAQTRERAASLEKDATSARLALAELEKQVQPRTISPIQRAQLIAALTPAPKGPVIIKPKSFDPECEHFGQQVLDVLRASGFDASMPDQATLSWSMIGAAILVNDVNNPPPQTAAIQQAFRDAGFLFMAFPSRQPMPKDTVLIAISTRL